MSLVAERPAITIIKGDARAWWALLEVEDPVNGIDMSTHMAGESILQEELTNSHLVQLHLVNFASGTGSSRIIRERSSEV